MDMSAFGERLRQARKHAKLSQVKLGQLVGIAQGSLSELEKVGLSSTYTVQIAQACRVSPTWLATGEGDMLEHVTNIHQVGDAAASQSNVLLVGLNKSVPRIAWNEIQGYVKGMFKPPSERYEVVSARHVTERCFLLEVEGDSMSGPAHTENIPAGSLLVCDPDQDAQPGHYVIALHPKSGEPVFRRLVKDAGVWFLKANNPAYPLVEIDGPSSVVARVIKVKIEMDV